MHKLSIFIFEKDLITFWLRGRLSVIIELSMTQLRKCSIFTDRLGFLLFTKRHLVYVDSQFKLCCSYNKLIVWFHSGTPLAKLLMKLPKATLISTRYLFRIHLLCHKFPLGLQLYLQLILMPRAKFLSCSRSFKFRSPSVQF